jgi:hypothetical protein
MPRLIIDLPYVPESDQIAQIIAQQVTATLPGAQVQIVDTAPNQPDMASARGMTPQSPTPQRPLTNQPMPGPRPFTNQPMPQTPPQTMARPQSQPMARRQPGPGGPSFRRPTPL